MTVEFGQLVDGLEFAAFAMDGGSEIGQARAEWREVPGASGDEGVYFSHLYVLEQWRKGKHGVHVGSVLVQMVESWANEMSLEFVWAVLKPRDAGDLPALIRFFRSQGYVVDERTRQVCKVLGT